MGYTAGKTKLMIGGNVAKNRAEIWKNLPPLRLPITCMDASTTALSNRIGHNSAAWPVRFSEVLATSATLTSQPIAVVLD